MQINVGARCWDGPRQKSLPQALKVHFVEELPPQIKRRFADLTSRTMDVVGLSLIPLFLANTGSAFAATSAAAAATVSTKEKILHAFDPLIDLAISLSYPIAGVMIAGGCLFIMIGMRERGMDMLKNAALGYILVQLSPTLLRLLVGVGGSI